MSLGGRCWNVVDVLHKFRKYLVEQAVRYNRLLASECNQYSYCSICEIYAAECRWLVFVSVDSAFDSGCASFNCKREWVESILNHPHRE
jgi:hypothetical protein